MSASKSEGKRLHRMHRRQSRARRRLNRKPKPIIVRGPVAEPIQFGGEGASNSLSRSDLDLLKSKTQQSIDKPWWEK